MQDQLLKQGYVLRSGWNDAIEHSFEVWYRFTDDPSVSHYATYIKKEHRNSAGLAHGGMLAAFLDHCMGSMCWRVTNGGQGWTITFNMQFVRPARVGHWVFAEIQHLSGSGINLLFDGKLYQDSLNGRQIAQAQGSFTVPGKKAKKQLTI